MYPKPPVTTVAHWPVQLFFPSHLRALLARVCRLMARRRLSPAAFFAACDRDRDAHVSWSELQTGLRWLGLSALDETVVELFLFLRKGALAEWKARYAAVKAGNFPGLFEGGKPKAPVSMPDPLVFYSWWNEEVATPPEFTPSGQGMGVRRQVRLHYSARLGAFQLFTEDVKAALALAVRHGPRPLSRAPPRGGTRRRRRLPG